MEQKDIIFKVSDTGVGIPKNLHHQIFDKSIKIDLLEDEFPRGVGLGLSNCRLIVENMHGHVWPESEAGNGSAFVRIPLHIR